MQISDSRPGSHPVPKKYLLALTALKNQNHQAGSVETALPGKPRAIHGDTEAPDYETSLTLICQGCFSESPFNEELCEFNGSLFYRRCNNR